MAKSDVFDVQRELVDMWKDIFCFETIPDWLRSPTGYGWNFSNLQDAFKEDGILHGNKVYLCCCSDLTTITAKFGRPELIPIPVILAFECPFPPFDKLSLEFKLKGGSHIQKILPMKDVNLGWIPYEFPTAERRESTQIFMLSSFYREALVRLKSMGVTHYTPYIFNPLKEDYTEQSTIVRVLTPVDCEFDWEEYEVEEFADQLIATKELCEDQKLDFTESLKDKVIQQKRANLEAKIRRERVSSVEIEEFERMRIYKFYPVTTHHVYRVDKDSYVNRFFGNAHQLFY